MGRISVLLIQSLTRKYKRNRGKKKKKDVFKPIKASATPALTMLLNRSKMSVSLEGASRHGLPGHTDTGKRGKRDIVGAVKEVVLMSHL